MFRALNTAATGMAAQQMNIDVTANNMANVNTTGFRRSRAEFQDLIYQTVRAPGGRTGDGSTLPTGIQIGQGTRTVSTTHEFEQGALMNTGGEFDVAIEGNGFFQIQRPQGDIAYTRSGNFHVDPEGRLVTVDGLPIEPAITLPLDRNSVTISQEGVITVTVPGETAAQEVGRLQLANFPNPAGLEAIGRSMFIPTDASGEPVVAEPGQEGIGTLTHRSLEGSNVQVVNEMIDLIASQRAYEINQKVIETADEMIRRATR